MKNITNEGGRASWEDPQITFQERITKHWRQMLVHLWGPAGSLAFHVIAISVLLTFATSTGDVYIESNPVEIVPNNTPEKIEEIKEVIPVKPENKLEEVLTPNELPNSEGLSTVSSTEPIGSVGNKLEGSGLGTDDPSNPNKGFEIDVQVVSRLKMKGLFNQRTSGGIQGALGQYNKNGVGGAVTEAAVLRSLRWLKREQQSDGSWKGSKQNVPPAMTAMALLAYLAHGETTTSPEFGPTVKKAIDWMLANQEANGHFKGRDGNDYSQPIGAYALCEAYALIPNPLLQEAAIKAITEVVKGQHANGGFNYNLNQDIRDDSSYMAWCCQALKAAKMAGLEADVPGLEASIKKAITGFKLNADASGGFGYTGKGRTGLSGAGTLCLQLLGNPKAVEVTQTMKFLETCTFSFATPDQQPYGGGSQVYYWYYITQAKFHYSAETFAAWNKLFSPELCKQQIVEKNAIEDLKGNKVDVGHWESPSKGEHTGGTVQDTALCTLMLEVYYRYLPSFKPIEEEIVKAVDKKDEVNIKIN